ncbi:methyl-accepting chemotaxis protein I [Sulfuriferula nivalis]|uniref:Methyl-accepting chemotaxis protein I n=2 Tax=Sulfuriferula nivalis TaxID=2675298 RepID=A0A809SDN5_9PROT|nr:methyl-accepting chemotaxis protein I [Sulfuriferula nivalis]
MNLHNLKISIRLGFLAGFLMLTMLVVGTEGWYTFADINANHVEAMRTAALLESSVDTARSAQVNFKKQVQEWKDTLLRGNDPAAFDKYSKAFSKRGEETHADLQKLKDLFVQLGLDTKQVDEALQTHEELGGKYLEALKQYDVKNPNSSHIVDALVKGMDRPPTQKIEDIVTYVRTQSSAMVLAANKKSDASYQTGKWILLVTTFLAVVIGVMVTIWLIRSIVVPLRVAIGVAETVASGDLTSHIDVSSEDETGELMRALRKMNDSLVAIVGEVRMGTESIASASAQIASGNLDLSNRTEAQAGSLEETASAMEELTSTVKQNADNARQANQLAATASEVASRGGVVVAEVVSTMGEINDSARKIADIIGVIDGIAFQTNILALNAAVEAARAGEQGRGFAVVATEVRSLAQRSAAAAKEIKLLIDDSVDKVEQGNKQVAQAGTTMGEVVSSVQRVTDIMGEISAASREQSQGIEEINQAITQMDETTQQNAALVEEAAAAAKSLQDQASNLENVVDRFELGAQRRSQQPRAAIKHIGGNQTKQPVRTISKVHKPAAKVVANASSEGWEEF